MNLTPRESEVHNLLLQGKGDREIARKLYVSLDTASTHINRVLKKTNNKTRVALIVKEYLSNFDISNLSGFDDRDKQIINAIATTGEGSPKIAKKLGLHPSTVRNRLNKIYMKTNTNNRQDLMLWLKDKVASSE